MNHEMVIRLHFVHDGKFLPVVAYVRLATQSSTAMLVESEGLGLTFLFISSTSQTQPLTIYYLLSRIDSYSGDSRIDTS